MTIYIDLDGVLADFDAAAEKQIGTTNIYKYEFIWGGDKFWQKINENDEFFTDLPQKSDIWDLLDPLMHLEPVILTALPKVGAEKVENQKREWVKTWIGNDVDVICCQTKDKPNYCKPGDVLIDDRAVNRDAWFAAGGIYIVHKTAKRTIEALKALGIIHEG